MSQTRVFRKGESVRVVETPADAVAAEFDGYREDPAGQPEQVEQPPTDGPKPTAPRSQGKPKS